MKIDNGTIQELYRIGALSKAGVQKVNIVNYYQNRCKETGRYGAVKDTAGHFKMTRQRVWQVVKRLNVTEL